MDKLALPAYDLLPETQAFLKQGTLKMLIGGDWVEAQSGETIDVFDPATGEKIIEVAAGGAEEIDLAVQAARKAFENPNWSRMSPTERGKLMWKLADLLEENAALFQELEVLDNGMTIVAARMAMFPFCSDMIRYYAGWPTKITGRTLPTDPTRYGLEKEALTYTLREPLGVVGTITPWNYPLGMLTMKLGPALATGCTLVMKPAELTPMTAVLLGRLIQQAGFPEGVVNIVSGKGETAGAALAAHAGVDKIAFTGSTEVGKIIVKAATGNLKKVSLELGGKSPFIVFPDAILEEVIPATVRASYFLQGQNCMAATRLFAHEDIYDRFVEGVSQLVKKFVVGPGMNPESTMGPLISSEQRNRVMDFVESGKQEGAELVVGGSKIDGPGYFIEPTLFSCPTDELRIVRNEIFGPVICVERFGNDDLDALARRANNTMYGLSGSVWTQNLSLAHRMARRIDSGQVGINCHAPLDVTHPFGGNKQSGWGREFGEEALDMYLKTKSITAVT